MFATAPLALLSPSAPSALPPPSAGLLRLLLSRKAAAAAAAGIQPAAAGGAGIRSTAATAAAGGQVLRQVSKPKLATQAAGGADLQTVKEGLQPSKQQIAMRAQRERLPAHKLRETVVDVMRRCQV